MSTRSNRKSPIRLFASDTHGAALVEFGMVLPLMLLIFAMIVESSRTLWSYQAAIEGVRDATRYVARVADEDICPAPADALVTDYQTVVEKIVAKRHGSDESVFAPSVKVNSVTPTLSCDDSGLYRNSPVGIATVDADITIQLPLARPLGFFGVTVTEITTVVGDSSRIFGT